MEVTNNDTKELNINQNLQIMHGIKFCKKHNLIKPIKDFNIPSEWSVNHISCLDELFISDGFIGWKIFPELINEDTYPESILFELEYTVKTGSCYDFNCYMYQLITEIKKLYHD